MAGDYDFGPAITAGLIVVAVGGAVAAAGIAYGSNKLYFEPHARQAEFNARARNVLADRHMKTISVEDFKKGGAGCAKPLYGAGFMAEDTAGRLVRGSACVSRTTELNLRIQP